MRDTCQGGGKIKNHQVLEGNLLKSAFQFLNGAGNSPKDRVALSIIEMV